MIYFKSSQGYDGTICYNNFPLSIISFLKKIPSFFYSLLSSFVLLFMLCIKPFSFIYLFIYLFVCLFVCLSPHPTQLGVVYGWVPQRYHGVQARLRFTADRVGSLSLSLIHHLPFTHSHTHSLIHPLSFTHTLSLSLIHPLTFIHTPPPPHQDGYRLHTLLERCADALGTLVLIRTVRGRVLCCWVLGEEGERMEMGEKRKRRGLGESDEWTNVNEKMWRMCGNGRTILSEKRWWKEV